MILLQTSHVAGFQYHHGEEIWDGLHVGQPLDLIREPDNAYDERAVRATFSTTVRKCRD